MNKNAQLMINMVMLGLSKAVGQVALVARVLVMPLVTFLVTFLGVAALAVKPIKSTVALICATTWKCLWKTRQKAQKQRFAFLCNRLARLAKALVHARVHNPSLVRLVAVTAKCACNKGFSPYSKLVQNVMVTAKWSKILAQVVMVPDEPNKIKPYQSRFLQALMKATELG